ncbi:MAG: helix-turn-helix domain-containing protein [Pyrinomonadaceae bacterium]
MTNQRGAITVVKTTHPQAHLPRLLTVAEVASLLRLEPRTIYNMVSQGRIPFRKAGRQLRFAEPEIEEWTRAGAAR